MFNEYLVAAIVEQLNLKLKVHPVVDGKVVLLTEYVLPRYWAEIKERFEDWNITAAPYWGGSHIVWEFTQKG